MTTSTALQRQQSSWPPTQCRPSTPTTTRKSTHRAICPVNSCSLRGKTDFIARWLMSDRCVCMRHVSLHDFWHSDVSFSEFWTSTNSTRISGRRGFKCGTKNTRAWLGNKCYLKRIFYTPNPPKDWLKCVNLKDWSENSMTKETEK